MQRDEGPKCAVLSALRPVESSKSTVPPFSSARTPLTPRSRALTRVASSGSIVFSALMPLGTTASTAPRGGSRAAARSKTATWSEGRATFAATATSIMGPFFGFSRWADFPG